MRGNRRQEGLSGPRKPRRVGKWHVGYAGGRLGWYAGPVGTGLFAIGATKRRWVFFLSWREAFDYAFQRATEEFVGRGHKELTTR